MFIIIEVYELFVKGNNELSVIKTLGFVFIATFLLHSNFAVRIISLIPGSYGMFISAKWNSYIQYDNMDALANVSI